MQEVSNRQKGKESYVLTPSEGIIQNDVECHFILQHRKFISELKGMGFEVNPIDPCVVNKMVNSSQMMVRWQVDDLMSSHISNEAILQFIHALKDIHGDKLAENTGRILDYLGMIFDFLDQDKVKINMTEYISKVMLIYLR
jgi:hypothetical protein